MQEIWQMVAKNLAALCKVKTIVTLVEIGEFAVQAFYFGTQSEKP